MPHILCGNPQRLHPAKLLHRPHRGKQKLLLNFETVEIPHPVAGPVAQQPFRLFAADRLNARRNHLAGKVVDLMVECKLHSAHRIDQGPDSGKGDGGRTVNLKAELASQNTGNPLCRVVGAKGQAGSVDLAGRAAGINVKIPGNLQNPRAVLLQIQAGIEDDVRKSAGVIDAAEQQAVALLRRGLGHKRLLPGRSRLSSPKGGDPFLPRALHGAGHPERQQHPGHRRQQQKQEKPALSRTPCSRQTAIPLFTPAAAPPL